MLEALVRRPIRIHHIAFAESGDAVALQAFTSLLGLEVTHTEQAPGFVERMIPVGECSLQSLSADGDGVVERFVSRRGPGLHHVAFEVDDLGAELERLRAAGAELIDETPRPGGTGTMIAFLHPRTFGGILVELVEAASPATI